MALETGITAQELKDILMDMLLAAGGCLKARPSFAERARLRRSLRLALIAHKKPVKGERLPTESEVRGNSSSPVNKIINTDPVDMVARYVQCGGNWQALIAAITRHGRTGQTRQNHLTNPAKDMNHDNRIQH
ncbi:MAG: hypothetical protein COA47_17380 [Robiginitomaculum sp.]|nr:MAG: hypothetical protein COA47_17380 [Robiginitomaculum sp.]